MVLQLVKDEKVRKTNNKKALRANQQNSDDSGSYDFNVISWQRMLS